MMDGLFAMMTSSIGYDEAALITRCAVGAALLPWGLDKFFNRREKAAKFRPVGPLSPVIAFGITMLIETCVPICLFLGFLTRLAVIPAICSFFVATKVTKGPYFTSPASLYLFMMIALLFIGSGQYSLDYLIQVL